jgi:hypothetical protein
MISKESIDRIELIKRDGEVIKISCSDISEAFQLGVNHMWDSLLCEFNDQNYKVLEKVLENCEVRVISLNSENKLEESFYGIMERVKMKDESEGPNRLRNQTKDPESRMVTLIARGFSILLHLKVIEREIKYEKGFGDVIKQLVEPFNIFDVSDVVEDPSRPGILYFDNMTIFEVMDRLAHTRGWCLKFKGKSIIFKPCLQPKEDLPSNKTYLDLITEISLERNYKA